MTRYLTPSKIGLLVLIELYTDGAVSSSSTIPILSFILNQLLPSAAPKSQPVPQPQGSSSTPQKQPRPTQTDSLLLEIKTFEDLLKSHPSAHGVPGRTLFHYFLAKIWDIDSIDALHAFFERRLNLLAKSREERKDTENEAPAQDIILISRTSPLGTFIRRSNVEFERLRFSDVMTLWMSFMQWRQSTKTHWAKRCGGNLSRWAGDRVLDVGEEEWGSEDTEMLQIVAYGGVGGHDLEEGRISTDDVEKALEFQVEQMQKLGSRIPVELRDKFRSLLDESLMIPSLSHYLNFLEAWRAGDYPTSFDNLHRYFDYTMSNRDRLFYQYALMNLAVLQADFGCYDEAMAAMLETVSTARENKDLACLNFALNWLYHFGKAHPRILNGAEATNILGVEKEGLSFLRIKAKETGMFTLWASSLLSEAKLGMSNGENVATIFENILKSSQLIVDKNMKSMMGPQSAMYSSLWGRLGIVQLSRQYCDVFLSSHAKYALFDDILRFTCRVAHLLTEKGKYKEAMDMLAKLDENALRSWNANQFWRKYCGILRLKRDLHRNNLDGAEHYLSQLLQSNGSEVDPDLTFEINVLHIDYLIRRTDYSRALAKIEHIAAEMQQDGDDLNLRVKLLTMKALLHDKAGRPQKGFSVAVRAASIAWRGRLIPALWTAMGAIANILTSLGEFSASSQILLSVIPRALECENCSMNAQLYSFLADAHMGMAGEAESGSLKRTENLTKASEFISRSFDQYSAVEDINGQCEMTAKKATILMALGDKVQANDAASDYLRLKKESAQALSKGGANYDN